MGGFVTGSPLPEMAGNEKKNTNKRALGYAIFKSPIIVKNM